MSACVDFIRLCPLHIKSEMWTSERMTERISFPVVHGVWTKVPGRKQRMQHLHLKRWHLQCWSGSAGMRGETGAGIAHIHLGDRTTTRMSKPRVRQHTKSHTSTHTCSKQRLLSKITLTIHPLISQTHAEINWWLFKSTFTSYRSNYMKTTAENCNICCSHIKPSSGGVVHALFMWYVE